MDLLVEFIGIAIGSCAIAFVVSRRHRRKATTTSTAFVRGLRVELPASLRGSAAPFPRRWKTGTLAVGGGPPTWRRRFRVSRKEDVLPLPPPDLPIRPVRGIRGREMWSVNPSCRVIEIRRGGLTVELAVLPDDLDVARNALTPGAEAL